MWGRQRGFDDPYWEAGHVLKKDLKFQTDYHAFEETYAFAAALIDARKHAELTQEELALRMKTSQASIARLDAAKGNPFLNTLRRYAEATGTRLQVSFKANPTK